MIITDTARDKNKHIRISLLVDTHVRIIGLKEDEKVVALEKVAETDSDNKSLYSSFFLKIFRLVERKLNDANCLIRIGF